MGIEMAQEAVTGDDEAAVNEMADRIEAERRQGLHPRAVRVHRQHDTIECRCPWCGEDLPEVAAHLQSQEPYAYIKGPTVRTWCDTRGRVWHVDCADTALGAHGKEDQIEAAQALFDAIADWGEETFPGSFDGGRISHLRKELDELAGNPSDAEEMADIVLILCHHARAHGVNLAAAISRKFQVVKTRKWGKPDASGVVEHLRTEVDDGD